MPSPYLHDDIFALLCEALAGTDDQRLALVMALALMQPVGERETELARMRRDGPPPVFAS